MSNIHWNWTPMSVAAYLVGLMNLDNTDINNDSDIVIHLKGPFGLPGQDLMVNQSVLKTDENPTIPLQSITVGVGNVQKPHINNYSLSNHSTTTDLDLLYRVIGVMTNVIIPDGERVVITQERSKWLLTDFIIRTMLNSSGIFAIYDKPWGTEYYKPSPQQLQASVTRGIYVQDLILWFPINSNDPVGGGVWLNLRTNPIINILLDKNVRAEDLLPNVWFYADFSSLTLAHMNLVKQSGSIPTASIFERSSYDFHFRNLESYQTYYLQPSIRVPQNQESTVMANPAPQSPFIYNNNSMLNAGVNGGSSWMTTSPVSFTSTVPANRIL